VGLLGARGPKAGTFRDKGALSLGRLGTRGLKPGTFMDKSALNWDV